MEEELPSYAISIRAEHRSESRADGQVDHDLRKGPIPKYVDRDRSKLNTVIVKPKRGAELRQICEARRNGREGGTKRRMKSNAAVSTNLLIAFGKAAQSIFEALSTEQQDRAYKAVAERVAAALEGELTGLVPHRDESGPHAHAQMPAYRLDGKPISKVLNRTMAVQLQDVAAEAIAEFAPEIVRGKRKWDRIADGDPLSKIVHRSVAQLHRDLPAEIAAKERRKKELATEIEAEEERKDKLAAETLDLQQRLEVIRSDIEARTKERDKVQHEADTLADRVAKLEAKNELSAADEKRLETYRRQQEAKAEEAQRLAEELKASAEAEAQLVRDQAQAELAKLREQARAEVATEAEEIRERVREEAHAEGLAAGRAEAATEVEELREKVTSLHRRLADLVKPLRAFLKEVEAERTLLDRARIAFDGAIDFLRELKKLREALERRAKGYREGWAGEAVKRQDAPLLRAYEAAGVVVEPVEQSPSSHELDDPALPGPR